MQTNLEGLMIKLFKKDDKRKGGAQIDLDQKTDKKKVLQYKSDSKVQLEKMSRLAVKEGRLAVKEGQPKGRETEVKLKVKRQNFVKSPAGSTEFDQ